MSINWRSSYCTLLLLLLLPYIHNSKEKKVLIVLLAETGSSAYEKLYMYRMHYIITRLIIITQSSTDLFKPKKKKKEKERGFEQTNKKNIVHVYIQFKCTIIETRHFLFSLRNNLICCLLWRFVQVYVFFSAINFSPSFTSGVSSVLYINRTEIKLYSDTHWLPPNRYMHIGITACLLTVNIINITSSATSKKSGWSRKTKKK